MRYRVMGKLWWVFWVAKGVGFVARRDKDGKEMRMSKTDDGLTEGPWLKNKRIFLRHGLRSDKRRIETYIHEFMHAADWPKDEDWVLQFGHDLANFLWALGVRIDKDYEPEVEPVFEPETLEG